MNTPEVIASNLSRCTSELTTWNKSVIGNIPRKIQEKRKALNNLTAQDHDGSHGVAINEIRKEINDLLDSEEILSFYDINAAKFIGIERETKIQNSSMIGLLTEGRRTLFWACGKMKADGVMTRTISRLLH